MVLTTSLNRIRACNPCASGWRKLLTSVGATYDPDAPINLLRILDSNGVADCLWALQATEQNCDVIARLMAADFAESVLPIFERQYPGDARPRAAIQAARDFALGRISAAARAAAEAAAKAAAWAAGRDSAWDAAEAAAWAAAKAAAWAAARDAAKAAAWAAAEAAAEAAARDAQSVIIRAYLLPSKDQA
jgi:hypothetical protein